MAASGVVTPLPVQVHAMTWAAAQHSLPPKQWAAAYLTSLGQLFPTFSSPVATDSIGAGSDAAGNATTVQIALASGGGSLQTAHGLMNFATTCPYFTPASVSAPTLVQADASLRAPLPSTLASAAQCGRACALTSKAMMASRTPCVRLLLHPETSKVMSNVSDVLSDVLQLLHFP